MSAAVAESIFVVCNPGAGRGRGARVLPRLLAELGPDVKHASTRAAGEEADLAQAAAEQGFTTIVAIGGDGTWSNVAGGLLRSTHPAKLALVAGGTGCDFAKSLGIPAQDLRAAARLIRAGRSRRVDVGRIEQRYFLNVAGFGYDIAVIEDSWKVNWLRGDLRYVYCALRQMRSFPGFEVELERDGKRARHRLLMLVAANGRHFGGAFRLAPQALQDDGQLELCLFDDAPPLQRLLVMGRLMRGVHFSGPHATLERFSRLTVHFDAPPAYETDGEWRRAQASSVEVTCEAARLDVLVEATEPGAARS